MGLEQLCAEIEAHSQSQASAIIKAAHEEAKRILDSAHSSAQRTLQEARREAEAFSAAEASSRLTATQLEASRRLVEAREEAVRQSLEQVWEYYSQMPRRAGYAAKLKEWAQKALDELGQSGAILYANEADAEILRQAGFKVARKAIECAGGVRAETADGKIAVDYTLEEQFERKKEQLLALIHQKLFSPQDLEPPPIPPAEEVEDNEKSQKQESQEEESKRVEKKGSKKHFASGYQKLSRKKPKILDFSSMPISSRSSFAAKKARK
jgi:vacuolar-type H+-ATPase subunit E/Vma4